MIDTLRLSVEDALGLLERKQVSGTELHRAYLDAVGERDGELHCYLRTVENAGGDGVPIALKDVISTKGIETTAGLEDPRRLRARLRRDRRRALPRSRVAGDRQDEHGRVRDGLLDRELGLRPDAQPVGPERVPGGSGGGTAAAVSAGLAPWGLGSDTGGSIKQPSALCGNVGLRPTYGTVSRYGVVAFASSLDQIGPVARNVRDCARLYSIIAGKDPGRLDDCRRAAGRAA